MDRCPDDHAVGMRKTRREAMLPRNRADKITAGPHSRFLGGCRAFYSSLEFWSCCCSYFRFYVLYLIDCIRYAQSHSD